MLIKHMVVESSGNISATDRRVLSYLESNPGNFCSTRDIAAYTGIGKRTVRACIANLRDSNAGGIITRYGGYVYTEGFHPLGENGATDVAIDGKKLSDSEGRLLAHFKQHQGLRCSHRDLAGVAGIGTKSVGAYIHKLRESGVNGIETRRGGYVYHEGGDYPHARSMEVDGEMHQLGPVQGAVLEILRQRPNEVVPHEEFNRIWGRRRKKGKRLCLYSAIEELREKTGDRIVTRDGGYMWCDGEPQITQVTGLVFEHDRRVLRAGNHEVKIGPRQAEILAYFMRREGITTREELGHEIYGDCVNYGTLISTIHELNGKLGECSYRIVYNGEGYALRRLGQNVLRHHGMVLDIPGQQIDGRNISYEQTQVLERLMRRPGEVLGREEFQDLWPNEWGFQVISLKLRRNVPGVEIVRKPYQEGRQHGLRLNAIPVSRPGVDTVYLNERTQTARLGGQDFRLGRREYQVLSLLYDRYGEPVGIRDIAECIIGNGNSLAAARSALDRTTRTLGGLGLEYVRKGKVTGVRLNYTGRSAPYFGNDTRGRLILSHQHIVHDLARRYRNFGDDPADFEAELIGAGNVGLVKAADRFEHSRGCKFSTYARNTVKGEMLHYLRDRLSQIREPGWLYEIRMKVDRVQQRILVSGGTPTIRSVAATAGVDEDAVILVKETEGLFRPLSFDGLLANYGDGSGIEEMDDDKTDLFLVEDAGELDRIYIQDLLEREDPQRRAVLGMYFEEGFSGPEIAAGLGVSMGYVRHIISEAPGELRRKICYDALRGVALGDGDGIITLYGLYFERQDAVSIPAMAAYMGKHYRQHGRFPEDCVCARIEEVVGSWLDLTGIVLKGYIRGLSDEEIVAEKGLKLSVVRKYRRLGIGKLEKTLMVEEEALRAA